MYWFAYKYKSEKPDKRPTLMQTQTSSRNRSGRLNRAKAEDTKHRRYIPSPPQRGSCPCERTSSEIHERAMIHGSLSSLSLLACTYQASPERQGPTASVLSQIRVRRDLA